MRHYNFLSRRIVDGVVVSDHTINDLHLKDMEFQEWMAQGYAPEFTALRELDRALDDTRGTYGWEHLQSVLCYLVVMVYN